MNENAKNWVAALRSGKYKQCKQKLTDGIGHCCLGVGAELAAEAGVCVRTTRTRVDESGEELTITEFDGLYGWLSPDVREWLGLQDNCGKFFVGEENPLAILNIKSESSLAMLNDSDKTFAEIADVIESEPEGLFA
jgi:hypothetical protein